MRYLLNCFIIAMVLILSINYSQAQMPREQRHRKDSMRGVKLIWPQMNGFCPYTGIFSVQKIQIRYLSLK